MNEKITWLKQHQVLIIAVLLIASTVFLANKWVNSSARHADERLAVAQAQLEEQRRVNAQNDANSKLALAQYQAAYVKLEKENADLKKQIAARHDDLNHQQQVDQTLPLPELAIRWQQLADINKEDLQATTAGITVTDSASRKTVVLLEEIPILKQDLEDQQTIINNKDQEIGKCQNAIDALNTQITGLKTTIQDEKDTCKAQVADIKANARKSKRNWFIVGYVAGWASAIAVRVFVP